MSEKEPRPGLTKPELRTPRAAAIAGVIFSVLLLAVFYLMRLSVPSDPLESGAWLRGDVVSVKIAINLVPFAGVAFLWFMGALRDRLGLREDRFFATVFFGSGLLFLASLFASSAVVGAIILAFHAAPERLIESATFHFGRGLAYGLINVYVVKAACVFMFTTSTIAYYTRLTPRWIAVGGYPLAVLLLIGSYYFELSLIGFPLWVLLLSLYMLFDQRTAVVQASGSA